MALAFPFAVAAGAATAFAVRKRKQPRLIDVISQRTPAQTPLVEHLMRGPVPYPAQIGHIVKIFIGSAPTSEAEQQALAELKRVAIGAGLAVGGFFWSPLQIAGVLCLLPTMKEVFIAAYRHVVHERRATGDLLSAVFLAAALGGGLWFPLNVGGLFLVLTKWLAVKTEDQSKQGIIDLFGQQIRSVWLLVDGTEVEVPVERVQPGDQIVIHAGQMAPMDGLIVAGHASIDQHMLTGEAQPAEKGPGDRVLAATIVLTGRITVAVEKAGEATTAAQIGRILTDTSDFKESLVARATEFNDRMALPFLLFGGLTLPFIGLDRALGVLTGTPGYRMVLYGPLSMLSYLHLAAQQGILIKDGRSLELLQEVDTVVFDKTGTLTLDQPFVSGIYASAGFCEETVLTYAAAAETKQSHPIARAILE
ncbi:MAG TPA: HAD-IC family P-type ATPase, partial [Caldilineaceae bacterium]|nr:HAD-IC family P-type ATPase [Caldilineaceae bacterium]